MATKRKAPGTTQPTNKKQKAVPSSTKPVSDLGLSKRTRSKNDGYESFSDAEADVDADQTAALLKGFGSSSDSDNEDESGDDAPDKDNEATSPKRLDLALLPDPASTSSKKPSSTTQDPKDPTVLYMSRIPHGFHEPQMRSYFAQFGQLTHLRLARNRRTGASKHFAFLQFAAADVADIVARTMNNYLLFGHLLKCRVVSWEEVERLGGVEGLFRGSGRRWKKVPWNAIDRGRVARTHREGWAKRVQNEKRKRDAKVEKLKELGYEFRVPALKSVDDVPVQANKAIEDEKEDAKMIHKAIAAAPSTASENEIQALDKEILAPKERKVAKSKRKAGKI